MKGDFSRSTFSKKKHYRKVWLQQGRVQVDADWNEQVGIQDYHDITYLKDIIGQSGAPIEKAGFSIELKEAGGGIESLSIGKGQYFVDGILIENETGCRRISEQEDFPWYKRDGTSLAPELVKGTYLAYLDVWERHITAIDDPEIRESALGEADTATRSKVVWQVKLSSIGDILPSGDGGDVKDRIRVDTSRAR